MSSKFARGVFTPKNPNKYIGIGQIYARSSWEFTFMRFLDNHPSVAYWASESIKIPYMNPFTKRQTVYVPDFFIVYVDKNNTQHTELIEVKPMNQTIKELADKSMKNKAHWILNQAKWLAAKQFCAKKGIVFRVICENDIYKKTSKLNGNKNDKTA